MTDESTANATREEDVSPGRSRKHVRRIVGCLIVLVAGAAIVAVAVLGFIKLRMVPCDTAEVGALRSYIQAQRQFRKTDHYGKGRRLYANPVDGKGFPDLYEVGGPDSGGKVPNLIDRDFAEATSPDRARCGYWFVDVTGDANGSYDFTRQFGLCAVPAEYGRSGRSTFIIDARSEVYLKNTKGQPVTIWPDVDEEGWIPLSGR